jgi:hypothetical protein
MHVDAREGDEMALRPFLPLIGEEIDKLLLVE